MKRTEPLKISQIVDRLVSQQGLEDNLLAHRALGLWPAIVGQNINRLTVERRVKGTTLLLRIASSPLRHELSMHRTRLLELLNEALPRPVLTDIKFL